MLMNLNQSPQTKIQLDLDTATSKLSSGKFQEVLDEASLLLPTAKTKLHRATCHFMIGAALKNLGNGNEALPHFLEATLAYPTDQPFLLGHAQLEISEIQNERGLNESALFFIDMAISNFDLGEELPGTAAIKQDCGILKEKILGELNTFEQ